MQINVRNKIVKVTRTIYIAREKEKFCEGKFQERDKIKFDIAVYTYWYKIQGWYSYTKKTIKKDQQARTTMSSYVYITYNVIYKYGTVIRSFLRTLRF